MIMSNTISCPFCKEKLEKTHQGNYQTLSEHVCSPNETPILKDGFQCTNPDCIANTLTLTWLECGEAYMTFPDFPSRDIHYEQLNYFIKLLKVDENMFAINSWNYYYNIGKKLIDKFRLSINLGKYRFILYPKEIGGDNVKVQYKPNLFKWKLEIHKKEKNTDYYTLVIPMINMIIFSLKEFNRCYKNIENYKHDLITCYQKIVCEIYTSSKDDRKYVKITSWILKTFYKRKCEKVLKMKNEKGK